MKKLKVQYQGQRLTRSFWHKTSETSFKITVETEATYYAVDKMRIFSMSQ